MAQTVYETDNCASYKGDGNVLFHFNIRSALISTKQAYHNHKLRPAMMAMKSTPPTLTPEIKATELLLALEYFTSASQKANNAVKIGKQI